MAKAWEVEGRLGNYQVRFWPSDQNTIYRDRTSVNVKQIKRLLCNPISLQVANLAGNSRTEKMANLHVFWQYFNNLYLYFDFLNRKGHSLLSLQEERFILNLLKVKWNTLLQCRVCSMNSVHTKNNTGPYYSVQIHINAFIKGKWVLWKEWIAHTQTWR